MDEGPVIMQARVPVHADDTPETLAARVLDAEHRVYPDVVRLFGEKRVNFIDGRAEIVEKSEN
jgi:phosphoribosylglycinamide formyltransferase-1